MIHKQNKMSSKPDSDEMEPFKISQDENSSMYKQTSVNVHDCVTDTKNTKKRDSWTRGIDFLVACVGGSVGLGNVWRFPYLCYKNGGGAFLIPYFTCMVLASLPIFIMETAVGQYMTAGGLKAWSMIPLFQGIGLTTTIIIYCMSIYYNMILGWTLLYFFHSFNSELPWSNCDNSWNTPYCTTNFTKAAISNLNATNLISRSAGINGVQNLQNITSLNLTEPQGIIYSLAKNATASGSDLWNMSDPVNEFWERKVLAISDGIDDMGSPKWDLVLCLLLSSALVYLCICKGIKSSGKVMYFTAPAPYFFMIVILIRNATLDGASDGVGYYLRPNITKLTDIAVWTDAGKQIFYSSSVCQNVIVTLGSYNKFKHNSCRDSVAFAFVNAFTSIFSGFLVFTILGFMSFQQGRPISEVAESGPGLAFIAYPKAVAQMPLSQFWSASFFIMVLLLGLDSQFLAMETVMTTIMDQFPQTLRRGRRKEIVTAAICIITFVMGIMFTFNGGMYLFQIFDSYCAGKNLILMGFVETFVIAYFYGFRRFIDNLEMMVGKQWTKVFRPYLSVCLLVAAPGLCLLILILGLTDHQPLTYNRPMNIVYEYPMWVDSVGWTLAIFSIIWIPIVALHKLFKYGFTKEVFQLMLVPYDLKPHQRRPQDKNERSLKTLEQERQCSKELNQTLVP